MARDKASNGPEHAGVMDEAAYLDIMDKLRTYPVSRPEGVPELNTKISEIFQLAPGIIPAPHNFNSGEEFVAYIGILEDFFSKFKITEAGEDTKQKAQILMAITDKLRALALEWYPNHLDQMILARRVVAPDPRVAKAVEKKEKRDTLGLLVEVDALLSTLPRSDFKKELLAISNRGDLNPLIQRLLVQSERFRLNESIYREYDAVLAKLRDIRASLEEPR